LKRSKKVEEKKTVPQQEFVDDGLFDGPFCDDKELTSILDRYTTVDGAPISHQVS
jgi:hypothetical protein